jgi:pyrroline-5-carboxylate reductase
LGHVIAERSEELGYRVIISDGDQNEEVARESQILAICVKPCKASEVAEEIKEAVNGASVISFMAAVPIDKLRAEISPKVERAMTNLGLDSICHTDGDEQTTRFCENLSRGGTEKTSTESRVDMFTIAIGCLPGIAAWQFANNAEKADQWLSEWTSFLHEKTEFDAGVFTKIIREVKEAEQYEETVNRVKTHRGVTEAMIDKLEQNVGTDLEELLFAATERNEEIAKRI